MQMPTISQAEPQMVYNTSVRERCSPALLKLHEILLSHAACDDALSLSLRNWATVASFELCPPNQEEELLLDNVERQLMSLESIFHNNLNADSPLIKDPYWDGEWLWEKSDLERNMRRWDLSPYNFQPLYATPHAFAKAIRQWSKEFVTLIYPDEEQSSADEEGSGNLQPSVSPTVVMPLLSSTTLLDGDEMQFQMSLHMAQSAVTSRQLRAMTALAIESESKVVWLRDFYAQEFERERAIQRQQRAALQNLLEGLDRSYQQRFEIFRTNLKTAQLQLATERNHSSHMETALLAMQKDLRASSAEIVALEARHQQNLHDYNARTAELHNEIIAEQEKAERKAALIEALNGRVQAILVEQTAQLQKFEATRLQLMSNNYALQNEVAMAINNFQLQQAKAAELENQICANAAAQKALQQQLEEEKRQLQQTLEAQMVRMVTEHANEIQQKLSLQMESLQRTHQQELDQRLQATQTQIVHLQGQVNGERLGKEQMQVQVNSLQSQLAHQQQLCNAYSHQITVLGQELRHEAGKVIQLNRKVDKAKRNRWKFW